MLRMCEQTFARLYAKLNDKNININSKIFYRWSSELDKTSCPEISGRVLLSIQHLVFQLHLKT